MKSVGELKESGLAVRDNPGAASEVMRVLQGVYYDHIEMTDWVGLRRVTSLTFAGTETTGKQLPANLVNVKNVACVTAGDERKYYPTNPENKLQVDGNYHWYFAATEVEPIAEQKKGHSGLDVQEGSNKFTGGAATWVDEYIKFGVQPGMYKITEYSGGRTTFTPRYWGPRLDGEGYIVRPYNTRSMCILDREGEYDSGSINVWYWVYPPPLYQDHEMPLLPDTRALELAMWIDLIGPLEKRQAEAREYRDEYENSALPGLLSKNPSFCMPVIPRDRRGQRIRFGRHR